ncbi:MAG: NAD(P)-dependent oxidoreductase [Burkholderiales bacterium]|nr:NAD(P)-dependent oxidoreductase [Burkholderiales bacterium]
MKLRNIGIVSPGDMGQAVAQTLRESGLGVHVALEGRSARTRALALEASLNDCGSMRSLVEHCDMLLSILNPAAAVENAQAVAAAMRETGCRPVFVDCNAIAPQTMRDIDGIIRSAGGECIDAGIIGPPPRGKASMRFYASGPQAGLTAQLASPRVTVRMVSDRIGDASAVKMCYASYSKAAVALGVEMLVAAHRLGVHEALEQELLGSSADNRDWILKRTPSMPPKAYRWVPEMLEIAKTFEGVGMTPRMLQGAADLYEMIAQTPLGRESPEEARDRNRDSLAIIRELAG